ncbi:hypothetical protein [Clostridium sp. ZBS18]|uniref:hypothetical protein n=1 Tax=Clostridium sp. ZBS18 TaxID=2949967 RepID=UPI002079DDE6|nr:hypothetical protein [Clostridium sp. ZBS18]
MTTYSLFELEPIFIDFKNESYNLGLDIQANQNDTLTLNFICRNNGIEEDMSKYKVELRVHNNNTNTDYIQTQNENVTLGTDGSVKIVCKSKNGNKLTAYSGQCNGVLRIFNAENKQKATRIITMRIVADPLETDRANICESTITKLEDLDWILNEAYNIEDEFKKAIEEAIKQKNELIKTTNEAKVINSTLAGNITTGTELNSNLVKSNKLAETNQKELDTRNTTASQNIETLTNKNTIANETIVNISEKIETGSKLDNDLGLKIPIGTTLKNDLDTNIKTGTQLKTDLTELIPKVEKSKSDLDASKTNADLSNTTLTETTNNAETKKQEIVAECKVADEKIKQMNEFGDVTEVVKDVTSLKTEITTARDNETDLNARLERDKTNILNTIGNVNVETDGNVVSQLKDCAKNIGQLSNPNILINGDFQVWQRGTSFANVTNHYTADRWLFGGNTGAKVEKTNNGTKITLLNDGGWANYLQSIEHDTFKKLIGKTVTVTFKLSEKTNKVSQLWSLEYTNPRHYYMNKDFNDGVMRDTFTMTFEIGANTENAEIGIQLFANKGNSITIKYVKLEIGSVSTPFTPRPYAEELALCQRYYLSTDGYENNWMHGCYVQGGGFRVFIPSLSKFRITPTTIQNKLGQTEFFGDDAKWHELKYVQSYPLDGGGAEIVYTLDNPNGMATIGNSYIIRNLPSLNAEL